MPESSPPSDSKPVHRGLGRGFADRIVPMLVLLWAVGVTAGLWHVSRLQRKLTESAALSNATMRSELLEEFRTLYTSEVVERVRGHGIAVTHDYLDPAWKGRAIPLPVTLTIALGGRLGAKGSGAAVRLYSDHPFPWRTKTGEGGPQDDFERTALARLRERPGEPYFEFTTYRGAQALRYATADVMRPSCVACHNAHPDSPKKDWREGDVRGVLEVIRPIQPLIAQARVGMWETLGLVGVAAALGLGVIGLVVSALRRDNALLGERVAQRTAELEAKRVEAERLRNESRLQETQRLESLGVLAGGIAHDFNNLLTAMLGYSSLARQELPAHSPARPMVEAIETAASRAGELTRQLLAYAGKGRYVIEPLRLDEVVGEMATLLATAVSKRAVLKRDFAPELPAIEGDAAQIRQLVLNLITNASDALGDKDGVITLRLTTRQVDAAYRDLLQNDEPIALGEYVSLEVSDTGVGMDAATLARIFDPFFTTKFTGRGLGLAAVQGIVRGHEGAIKVYSEPGRGTTFSVLLPVAEQQAAAAAEPTRAAPEAVGGLLLIIDDEPAVRSIARAIATRAGFECLLASDGEEGLRTYRQHAGRIGLVLLDLTMPRLSGEEVFRALRSEKPDLPVILMSGYNAQEVTAQFAGRELTGFLQKPFRAADLVAALQGAQRR